MIESWLQFLKAEGAQFTGSTLSHFGQVVEERQHAFHQNVITDLSRLGLIKVSGKDAQTFLQGQFTNDVSQVTDTQSQLSAWCNAKGRVLINFLLFKYHDVYYLLLPDEHVLNTLKRLQLYVLRADVNLENAGEQLLRIGLSGERISSLLQEQLFPPTEINQCVSADNILVIKIHGIQPRYIMLSDFDHLKSFWQTATAKNIRLVGTSAWVLLDILSGIPKVLLETTESFVPQMLNLQAIGGINFKKGCYVGQEVVARMKYLGRLKRRLYLINIEAEFPPLPGELLFLTHNDSESIGKIVNAQPHPDGGIVALAVIMIEHADKDLRLNSAEGFPIKLLELPYSLPQD